MTGTTTTSSRPSGFRLGVALLSGIGIIVLGWMLPVYQGMLHPAVVERAGAGSQSAGAFGLELATKSFQPNPQAARIVLLAAQSAPGAAPEAAAKLKAALAGTTDRDAGINYFLAGKNRQAFQAQLPVGQPGGIASEAARILELSELAELRELEPAIMLTAWLHSQNLITDTLSREILNHGQSGNIATLRRGFMAVSTLADQLDVHQLMAVLDLMPDVRTLSEYSHIALVQTMLPPFASLGNHDKDLFKDELPAGPMREMFDKFDADKNGKLDVQEWLLQARMPLSYTDFPAGYTAMLWLGTPEGARQVVQYLLNHGRQGDEFLYWAIGQGRGAVEFVVRHGGALGQRRGSGLDALAVVGFRNPGMAMVLRYVLFGLGALLLVWVWNRLWPLAARGTGDLPGYLWNRRALAVAGALVLAMISEPMFFQTAQSSEYDVAIKLPLAAAAADAAKASPVNVKDKRNAPMTGNIATSDMWRNVVMTLLFAAIQIWVYLTCVQKIRQIEEDSAEPRLKLRLLDNEDNFFDMGLYIGIGGTALGLALIMLEVFQKPVAAYASNIFGIMCVAAVKIWHVRQAKKRLIIQVRKAEGVAAL